MDNSGYSVIRAIRGPVTLITLGVLFALNNFTPYRFDQTWPVLLIVFGLLTLMKRGAEPPRPAAPPRGFPPPAYQQGPYTPPPTGGAPAGGSGPARGGFGTSAPPRGDAASGASTPEGGSV